MAVDAEDQPVHAAVPGLDALRSALDAKLAQYNECNAAMDLVLFQQARVAMC